MAKPSHVQRHSRVRDAMAAPAALRSQACTDGGDASSHGRAAAAAAAEIAPGRVGVVRAGGILPSDGPLASVP
jgi:hypothetical protein